MTKTTYQPRHPSRRRFLSLLPVGLMAAAGFRPSRPLVDMGLCGPHGSSDPPPKGGWDHPDPRPGIDATNIVADEKLANPSAAPVFAKAREIPEILDGIRCHCGCADLEGYRSLLSCVEGAAMAQFCKICQGEIRVAYDLHDKGKDLAAIRTSIDARYG